MTRDKDVAANRGLALALLDFIKHGGSAETLCSVANNAPGIGVKRVSAVTKALRKAA